jgi:transposase
MRPQGSPAELERRRLRAIELLERDVPVHVVADGLGVDGRSVRRWKRAYRLGGRERLQARPVPGRPARLTARQRQTLVQWMLKGPERRAIGRPCGRVGALPTWSSSAGA